LLFASLQSFPSPCFQGQAQPPVSNIKDPSIIVA